MIKAGRVAVVSGGGRGLGRAIAIRLAREGADVAVLARSVRRAVPFTAAYDAAKGGVVQLTRSLAREWARYGVTVNAVAPGHFPTSMSEQQFNDERLLRGMLRRIPAGRTGELEELAAMVAYLCAEDSGFVTGEAIAVDGGEPL